MSVVHTAPSSNFACVLLFLSVCHSKTICSCLGRTPVSPQLPPSPTVSSTDPGWTHFHRWTVADAADTPVHSPEFVGSFSLNPPIPVNTPLNPSGWTTCCSLTAGRLLVDLCSGSAVQQLDRCQTARRNSATSCQRLHNKSITACPWLWITGLPFLNHILMIIDEMSPKIWDCYLVVFKSFNFVFSIQLLLFNPSIKMQSSFIYCCKLYSLYSSYMLNYMIACIQIAHFHMFGWPDVGGAPVEPVFFFPKEDFLGIYWKNNLLTSPDWTYDLFVCDSRELIVDKRLTQILTAGCHCCTDKYILLHCQYYQKGNIQHCQKSWSEDSDRYKIGMQWIINVELL